MIQTVILITDCILRTVLHLFADVTIMAGLQRCTYRARGRTQ